MGSLTHCQPLAVTRIIGSCGCPCQTQTNLVIPSALFSFNLNGCSLQPRQRMIRTRICCTTCFRFMQQSCDQSARGHGQSIMGSPLSPCSIRSSLSLMKKRTRCSVTQKDCTQAKEKRQRQTASLWRARPLPQRDAHVGLLLISQCPESYSLDSDPQYFFGLGGSVMSLPRLMRCLGTAHSAADIYSYWNSLNSIATHRPHAWSKPARREAAFERMRETGHWRHRD